MKKALKAVALGVLLAGAQAARATPSTVWWTPATTYVQPYLVPHLTYDTYFGELGAYPIDTGIEIGILPFEKVQGEIGFDLNYPGYTKNGFLLNAKLGVPEGAFGEWSPGISAGIYGLGFKKDVNDYNVFHAEIGKTLGAYGVAAIGGYIGNDKLLVDENGAKEASGFMASYVSPDVAINKPGLTKINFFADLQTGKSALGGWGLGIGLYFTPAIDILTGPVFFLNEKVQPGGSKVLWSVQLDVDVDLMTKAKT
ncbi:MAG TPA: hypothetical protein VLD85_12765 [Anaeromyxobacteraceae bacterium]|nr:hypothetical protein [Anaeromyxobacteraceae bacterium]